MTDDEAEIRDSRIFGIGAKTTCSEWAYFPVQNIVSWLLILVVILYHICTTNTLNKRVNINILESYPKVDKFVIGLQTVCDKFLRHHILIDRTEVDVLIALDNPHLDAVGILGCQ